jgi:hypothetical protein
MRTYDVFHSDLQDHVHPPFQVQTQIDFPFLTFLVGVFLNKDIVYHLALHGIQVRPLNADIAIGILPLHPFHLLGKYGKKKLVYTDKRQNNRKKPDSTFILHF